MTATEALRVVQALADGRNPMTGQPLQGESVYQEPDVLRALFVAARALERLEQRERRERALPDRTGKAWDAAEDEQLCSGFDAGKTVQELAAIHKRTRGGVQSRLEKLGKMVPQPRKQF